MLEQQQQPRRYNNSRHIYKKKVVAIQKRRGLELFNRLFVSFTLTH
jgi:hypothetical protein